MNTLCINLNDTFSTNVTVQECDKYSELAFLKFTRSYYPEDKTGCNEMLLSPDQLEGLGRFLMSKAYEIKSEQQRRKVA